MLLNNVVARNRTVTIDTGADTDLGADSVTVDGLKAAKLNVKLGGGDDKFRLKNSNISSVNADGGAGADAFFDLLGNNLGAFLKINFEA